MSNTLVVIGVQNCFCIDKAKGLPAKIAAHIRESDYDHILFGKFCNDPDSNFHRILNFTGGADAPETDLHSDVAEFATPETTFEKASYSIFKCKQFEEYLTKHNIKEFDLCGTDYDACVLATAFEAFDLVYQFTILDTLCSVSFIRNDLIEAAEKIVDRNLRSCPSHEHRDRW